jgi:PAS domain S-box-containing protein
MVRHEKKDVSMEDAISMENVRLNNYPLLSRMLEYLPVGVAVYAASDLRLLEANPLFLKVIDTYIDPCWHHGGIIGQSLIDWGTWTKTNGMLDIFYQVASSGNTYQCNRFVCQTFAGHNTYWDWTLTAVRDEEERIVYLLQTFGEVAPSVQEQPYIESASSAVEKDHVHKKIVETVARSVRESLDTRHIGNIAINALFTYFQPGSIWLHIDDPTQQALRMLCFRMVTNSEYTLDQLRTVPYASTLLVAQAPRRREPLVIENVPSAVEAGLIPRDSVLVHNSRQGYLCVPLWFGDQFEGALTAAFDIAIQVQGPEVQTFFDCGTHIAAALAQARLHQAIANERARLGAILDQLPEGILLIEVASSSVSYANVAAASLLGIPLTDLINMPLHQYTFTQDAQGAVVDMKRPFPWNFLVIRALAGETVRSQETLVTQPSGETCVVLASSAPLHEKSGAITGALIVFQDITARKTLEHQKNEFLWMANHELRTPITIIQGFAELLRLKAETDSHLDNEAKRALLHIQEQSEYLTTLVEEMLNFSRIEQGQFTLHRASHDLLQTVRRVVDNQLITTDNHHIRLVLEGVEATDSLIGNFDERRLVQAINNLISNAVKYSPGGGKIEVGLRYLKEQPPQALIWVKDQGVGIAESELSHIFMRFYRSSSLDPAISGLGIGLFLAKEVVTGHGGQIWAESTLGQGSTFYILLPLQ